tara:strand:- start:1221 stop:1685 length:465 start_codon:yes stop_codon:yes gene_type:complete
MTTQKRTTCTTQKAIQVTLSNALDQSEKRLIEIAPSQTVRQAVVDAGMAPSSQFDVFSSVGEVVTNQPASKVDGETLYVGPARIAGGRPNIKVGDIVILTVGAFSGERARVTHVSELDVTVEMINTSPPLPFTVSKDIVCSDRNTNNPYGGLWF